MCICTRTCMNFILKGCFVCQWSRVNLRHPLGTHYCYFEVDLYIIIIIIIIIIILSLSLSSLQTSIFCGISGSFYSFIDIAHYSVCCLLSCKISEKVCLVCVCVCVYVCMCVPQY